MSDAKDQHEPSMEEILASIRRIISEDGDSPESTDAAAAPEAAPAAPAAAPTARQAAPEAPPTAQPAAAPKPAAAAPKPALIGDVEDDSDVLVLTEEVKDEAPPAEEPPLRSDELALALEPDDEPPPEPEPAFVRSAELEPPIVAPEPLPEPPPLIDDRLISEQAAAASLAAMSELVNRSHREPNIESLPMGQANQTLEDLTRELLRPILKSWLDDNLPQIVERVVREEIGRLAIDAQRR